jgi:uncharacterized protein (TIGR02246 family)
MCATRREIPIVPGVILVVITIAGLTACQPQGQPPSQGPEIDTAAIRASIDSLGQVVQEADQTGDAELFASTWTEDAMISMPGRPPIQGREAITADFRRRPPLPPGARFTIHPTEIRALSPEWAYVWGVDSLTYTPEGADEAVTETSTFLVLLRKTPEGWQGFREVIGANQH